MELLLSFNNSVLFVQIIIHCFMFMFKVIIHNNWIFFLNVDYILYIFHFLNKDRNKTK